MFVFGLFAILTLASPLRAESLWPCEPVTPSPGTDKFIQPGTRVQRANPGDLNPTMCMPKPGSDCTLGFLLRDDRTGHVWATAAGHCMGNNISQASNVYAFHPVHGPWGKVYFSVGTLEVSPTPTRDIAFIRIFDVYQNRVNASIPVFGGPVGMVNMSDLSPEDGIAAHHGMPTVPASPVGLPRVGIFHGWDAQHVASCTCATAGGDSGSPYLWLDGGGKAVGLHFGKKSLTEPSTTVTGLFDSQLALGYAYNDDWRHLKLYEAPLTPLGLAFAEG